jgi:hypothetical protein
MNVLKSISILFLLPICSGCFVLSHTESVNLPSGLTVLSPTIPNSSTQPSSAASPSLPPLPNVRTTPLVISGQSNQVYNNLKISSTTGSCILIVNSTNITIQNSEVGPCTAPNGALSSGIGVFQSNSVSIQAVNIHDTQEVGIAVTGGQGFALTQSSITRSSGGVYANTTTGVKIDHNQFLNMIGPRPRGQFVQFDKVTGSGNSISCNVGQNILGQSGPTDAINIYQSIGDAADPIHVTGNKILGGGPSLVGGGIMLGDGGIGQYQIAQANILVDPGQYGIAIASGSNIKVLDNLIYAKAQSFSNIGIYIWNQSKQPCAKNSIDGNQVNFSAGYGPRKGTINPYYQGDLSPLYPGYICTGDYWGNQNNWNAPINETIADNVIDYCKSP